MVLFVQNVTFLKRNKAIKTMREIKDCYKEFIGRTKRPCFTVESHCTRLWLNDENNLCYGKVRNRLMIVDWNTIVKKENRYKVFYERIKP